jgi:hypothetical protein
MREELDNLLCERYPKLFVNRHGDMKETCMCWGFECGDGWFNILNALCGNIQSHIDWRNETRERLLKDNPYNRPIPNEIHQVVVDQVKEKYGTLRFYYSGGDDAIDGMVSMAESMSGVTCEVCGDSGYPSEGGWIVTLCTKHHEEREFGK